MTDTSGLSRDDFSHAYQIMNDVLSTVHAQVQFAEAKNGALLAANLATVVGVGAILASDTVAYVAVRAWLFVSSIGLAGAGLIALSSFLPIMGKERHDYSRGKEEPVNLLFWGEIANASPLGYARAMFAALGIAAEPSKIHLDLADQIVINSGIARRKFDRFQPAAVVTVIAAVIPAIVLGSSWIGMGFKFA